VSFQAFSNFMIQKNKDSDSKEEILIAFKELANDKDFVTEEDLRKVMSNERVAFLLERMPKYHSGQGYDYKAWVEIAYK
jgi:Ca2+-binding EF-hand superfamily protein